MATVNTKKRDAVEYDPRKHILHGSASHHSYNNSEENVCLAYVRGEKDLCTWVRLGKPDLSSKELDTSWVHEVTSNARALVATAKPSKVNFIMVKRGDQWISKLTTSEDERLKRRVLRRISRHLKKARKVYAHAD